MMYNLVIVGKVARYSYLSSGLRKSLKIHFQMALLYMYAQIHVDYLTEAEKTGVTIR